MEPLDERDGVRREDLLLRRGDAHVRRHSVGSVSSRELEHSSVDPAIPSTCEGSFPLPEKACRSLERAWEGGLGPWRGARGVAGRARPPGGGGAPPRER